MPEYEKKGPRVDIPYIYQEYVSVLDGRRKRFHREIGKPTFALLESIGLKDVRRRSEFRPRSDLPVLLTTSTSHTVDFPRSTEFPIATARVSVARLRDPSLPVGLILFNTMATDYLRRTGLGKIGAVSIDYAERSRYPSEQRAEINTEVFAHGLPITTDSFEFHSPSDEARMREFNEVRETIETQLNNLKE